MNLDKIELSQKQAEYIVKATHRWNFKIGATQCGKTHIDTLYLIQSRIMERKGKDGRVFIIGVSKETIQRNIIEPMQEIWGDGLVTDINSKNESMIFGQKVYCVGGANKGRVSKFRGSRIKYVYIDEVVDIHKDVFDMLPSRLSLAYSCCDAAGNPQHQSHWFKQFVDRKDLDIYVQHYTIFDNPFLPEKYIEELCKEYKGTVYYQRYILGRWANAEGLIYGNYADDPSRYRIKKEELPILKEINIGIDFGGNKSFHGFVATGFNGRHVYALKSKKVKASGVTVNGLVEEIKNFISLIHGIYGRVDNVFCDNAEATIINTLIEELPRYDVGGCMKLRITDRIRCTCILMGSDRIHLVEDECDDLEQSFSDAMWDDTQKDDVRLDDFSYCVDLLDAFEYSIEPNIYDLIEGGL